MLFSCSSSGVALSLSLFFLLDVASTTRESTVVTKVLEHTRVMQKPRTAFQVLPRNAILNG